MQVEHDVDGGSSNAANARCSAAVSGQPQSGGHES